MTRRLVVGDLRVQRLDRRNGLRSWTIVWPEGAVHEEADRFLRVHDGSGTQKTYAYYLVDHLRWLDRECLSFGDVRLRDLERYMGVVAEMMDGLTGATHLDPWLASAEAADGQPELRSFANGIRQDKEAVLNGLTLPYSSGRVEGIVNKVKAVKRQMFGRASFPLLRKRIILHPA
jgi:hypothetical protein